MSNLRYERNELAVQKLKKLQCKKLKFCRQKKMIMPQTFLFKNLNSDKKIKFQRQNPLISHISSFREIYRYTNNYL